MKVLVGMSGGVDSSVAAWLLKEQGHDVEGLSLVLFETRGRTDPRACCSLASVEDAARTAEVIGIPHGSLDMRDEFISRVIEPFVQAYTMGLTPNPCVLCNREIKFPALLREAQKRGTDLIATGHYAMVERQGVGAALKKGADAGKDQSYVLYALRPEELARLVLPLGGLRKAQVREIAAALGLPAAKRPESQEICFVEAGDYPGFVSALEPSAEKPGPIYDMAGRRLGTHRGIFRYTVGQRKGLGLASPEPLYVARIDAAENAVFVGPREAALSREFAVGEINWLVKKTEGFRAAVKVRSMMEAAAATVRPEGGRARVVYDKPQWAAAPGQSAVFYEGDAVLGGGVIQPSGARAPGG
ncbi:MAG: tRNA 2-thiouridine(34) synthase MnmA [Thermodesulfovibrionales bacterium]